MSSRSLKVISSCVLLIVASLASTAALASHFRGGSITWQSVDLDGDGQKNDVQVTVKTAWRLNGGTPPSAAAINATPALTFSEVGTGTLTKLSESPDANGQYELSTKIFQAKDLDLNTTYALNYTSCCRISNLVNNANGDWNIQSTINLANRNLAPKIDLPIIFEVPQLQQDGSTLLNWTFNTGSTDPNADKLKFRLANVNELGGSGSVQPDGFSINPNTGVINWANSGNLAPGLYSAGVVAEDVDSNGVIKSKSHVDFILYLQNKKAVQFTTSDNVTETRNIIVEKGTTYTFDVNGTAIESTSLGDVQGALSEGTEGQFTFDPADLLPAAYPITFEIRDTTDSFTKNYLILNFIVPDPDAPKIANLEADRTFYADIPEQRVDENQDAVVTDRDNTHFSGGKLKFNVSFTDGTQEILGVMSSGDGAGQINRMGDQIYYEGNLIGDVDADEDGVGRALTIHLTGSHSTPTALTALVRALTYQDTFALREPGDRNLSLFIEDPDRRSNSYNFFVNVQAHPTRPTSGGPVEAANALTVVEGSTTTLSTENINYGDPDTDRDQITLTVSDLTHGQFELISAPGVAVTSFTQQQVDLGQVNFVHDGGEEAPVYKVSASDGTASTVPADALIRFTNVNDPPEITNLPGNNATAREPYRYTPTVTDVDSTGGFTFTIQNMPSWASFDTATGTLSGTPANSDAGTASNIVITVADTDGGTATVGPFSITTKSNPDSDGDGVPDEVELVEGTDPGDPKDYKDEDGDGVPDYVETKIDGTDPKDPKSYRDNTPPEVMAPPEVTVSATGLYTKISRTQLESLGKATASDSVDGVNCCSPYPRSLVDDEPFFPPGKHTIVWAAKDAKGNTGTAGQILNVEPLVSLSKDQTVPEGAMATIQVVLNGPAPAYPVKVPYTVSGTALNPADHDLVSGTAVINAGLTTTIAVRTVKDSVPEVDETMVVTLDKSLNRSPSYRHVLTISERNIAPQASLKVTQGGENRLMLLRDGAPAVISGLVMDANTGDTHSYEWDTGIMIDRDRNDDTVTLDPSVMEPGQDYAVTLVVTDDGSPALQDTVTVHLQVVDTLPALSPTADSDGDGIPDAEEGYGDADQDGIPDYLDSQSHACSVVPEEVADYQRYLMESDPGSCLKLGVFSRFASRGGSRLIDGSDIGANSPTHLPEDIAATNVGGVFDFTVDDLPQAGQSVRIVVPQRAAVPENPIYRKYSESAGWQDFFQDDKNQLASAPGEPGFCPTPGSGQYRPGLNVGDWCVQLTIEDGGPNDADGQANGSVLDPGGVATIAGLDSSGKLKTSGGGSMGPVSLLTMLALAGLARVARKRGLRKDGATRFGVAALGAAAALTLSTQAPTAQAEGLQGQQPSPIYLTASLGYAYTDVDDGDVERRFADRGYRAQVTSTDGSRLGGMLGAGYRLNDSFAFEVAYIDLGETEVSFRSTPIDRDIANVYPESGQGPAASVLYRYGLSQRWGLNVRVGAFFWDGDYDTKQGSLHVADAEDSGEDVYYGLGADYRFSDVFSFKTELQRFEFDRDPSYYLSAGMEFRFPELLK
ncbi:hypothetical protein RE428_10800 [Marinobacter nanhaiticus D15-8W]|uniref:Thrombospondin type 3 repeat family protein n=1 Tax=Marinobacter nanhaiticus D15-8W TaxID=626887 RepID=N6VRC1_9GAMM|nr:cadherin-like domain-containing protein [Marinobacter nanhaiticus]ENO12720.1 thrombospondin type 3 repeat family protein [Marinobacter nanhaiticus D15-8W]BES70062.1 hypothetical protein RE428_10800 [Marinobacter nanhaiticus D15-8W]